jgi:hypothetical protein
LVTELLPVPVKAIFNIGVVGSFDEIERFPLLVPPETGEKITPTVQLDDGGRVTPEQLSFSFPNSKAFVPVKVIVPITRTADLLLDTVKVWAADEVPEVTEPKSFVVGDTEATGGHR